MKAGLLGGVNAGMRARKKVKYKYLIPRNLAASSQLF